MKITSIDAITVIECIDEMMNKQLEKMYYTKRKMNNETSEAGRKAYEVELNRYTAQYEHLDQVRHKMVEHFRNQLEGVE